MISLESEIIKLRSEANVGFVHKTTIDSDSASSYSDLLQWDINLELFETAKDAASSIVALSLRIDEFNGTQEKEIREQIWDAISIYNEGAWVLCKELILQEPFTPYSVLEKYISYYGPYSYFGNYRTKILKRVRYIVKSSSLYGPKSSKVNKPKRKRGYDDKGHLSNFVYGTKDTTKGLPLSLKEFEPRPHIEEHPNWLEDIDPRVNLDQVALVENYASQELKKVSKVLKVTDSYPEHSHSKKGKVPTKEKLASLPKPEPIVERKPTRKERSEMTIPVMRNKDLL